MKITIYELLGLVKDGKAPKKIKYKYKKYNFDDDGIYTKKIIADLLFECDYNLNDEVEIIEEENKFTKEDFIKEVMDLEGLTREEFNKIYEVKECNCGRAFCKGFIKVEKVEEEKKIPEKLNDDNAIWEEQARDIDYDFKNVINDIIDYLDYLKSKGE